MKHLLLIILFSGSLSTFSLDTVSHRTSDTLRCTLIVYYDNGPAILHTKPGFVVRGEIFLDDRKKVIKAPWEVLTYKIKK